MSCYIFCKQSVQGRWSKKFQSGCWRIINEMGKWDWEDQQNVSFLVFFFSLFFTASSQWLTNQRQRLKQVATTEWQNILVVFRSAVPKKIHSQLLCVRYLSQKYLLLFLRTQRREGNARNWKIQIPHLISEGRRWWWHGRNHRLTCASVFRIKISFKNKKKDMWNVSG